MHLLLHILAWVIDELRFVKKALVLEIELLFFIKGL